MILIISSQEDVSTSEVIDWLLFYNVEFLRISEKDIWKYISVSLSNRNDTNIMFSINNKKYSFLDFSVIWYRRSFINLNSIHLTVAVKDLQKSINRHIENEHIELHQFAINHVKSLFVINSIKDTGINKITILQSAKDVGLTIPDSIITSDKSELLNFYKKHKKIITKNISQGVFIFSSKNILNGYTQIISQKMINNLPSIFPLSLCQALVEKWIELRIFFINNEFYASAIFSQNDEKTKIDFRNYNFDKPNRTPPFKLPQDIEIKLHRLMKQNLLNSGSIDMIITPNDEYVFLEVNPIGLFTQVSIPCNYYLEKEIAMFLKSKQ
jgi:ATP-GRASP peptide maturase of grasp-with-spasm system